MLLLKLQDQTFAFCRRFGPASIFSAVRSIFCYQAAVKRLKRPSYCVSPETQGSVDYTAIEWQYTATGR